MIQASVYGRLGADPIERQTRAGNSMATVSIAVNAARHGAEELTEWFSVVAFGRTGESLLKHNKGELVAVMGSLHRTRFVGRDGTERSGWSLTAESIVSARTTRPGGGKSKARHGAEQQDGPAPDGTPGDGQRPHPGADFDDEIPF